MPDPVRRPRPDWLPVAILLAILLVSVGLYFGFSRIQAWVAFQDCLGAGRSDCRPS
jgi:uncharacterized membrane protein